MSVKQDLVDALSKEDTIQVRVDFKYMKSFKERIDHLLQDIKSSCHLDFNKVVYVDNMSYVLLEASTGFIKELLKHKLVVCACLNTRKRI